MSDPNAPIEGDALGMSDEEFMKVDPLSYSDEVPPPDDSADPGTSDDVPPNDPPEEDGAQEDDAADAEESDDLEEDADPEEDDGDDDAEEGDADSDEEDADAAEDQDKDPESDASKDAAEKPADGELTEKQLADVGRQVMSEFKANGTMIKVKSAEDAIQLMQMGANYHKKMSGLKPSLKTLKLLENNDLLDPEKLNYLIDLSQKKPEAITKLLKDSKIDPMDLDLDAESDYKPNNRTVNDTELVLDEVLDSISDSPHYNRTLTVLADDWDTVSRETIAKNPEFIRTINLHMENGIFDQVASAVAYERSLGKLTGVSDLEAYQRVGTYMNENNLFKTSTVADPAPVVPQRQEQQPRESVPDKRTEERKKRKQAASPSRQRQAPAKDESKYNPLAMSDEEFAKLNKLNL